MKNEIKEFCDFLFYENTITCYPTPIRQNLPKYIFEN